MLIDRVDIQVTGSNSILSFETEGGGSWEVWDRFLAIDGKKAFHIGNICGTCSFFFERLEGANKSINAEKLVAALNSGVSGFDEFALNELERIMPDGKYTVTLSQVIPKLTQPRDENDYFTKEQLELWGVDGFWGIPHFPKTEYYRLTTSRLNKDAGIFEFQHILIIG